MSGSWPSDHRFSIVLGGAGPPDLDPGKPFREVAGELGRSRRPPASSITILQDHSRSILSHNDSPDLGFRWSANPYRGCQSACSYCYARPTHEYLDLGAGTDFDTKIVIKHDAPQLLRAAFDKPSWQAQLVMVHGLS